MLQLILLFGGMFAALYSVRLRHSSLMSHTDFDPRLYKEFLRISRYSMYAVVFACWGTLIVQMAITIGRLNAADYSNPLGEAGAVASLFILLGGLVVGGFMNVRAANLRWQAEIRG